MKTPLLLVILLALPLMAAAADYEITVERKKDAGGGLQGGTRLTSTQNWTGVIKIKNRTFKPSPELQVRYIIFVKRQQLGQATDLELTDKIKGSTKADSIKPGAVVTVMTSDVPLHKGQMAPGWRTREGGRQASQDSVHGIWVQLYDPEGNVVADYANPSTLKQKYEWQN